MAIFSPSHPRVLIVFSFLASAMTYLNGVSVFFPLSDPLQVFGYSDKINKAACASIETALFFGWKYQLIGPGLDIPGPRIFNGGISSAFKKMDVLNYISRSVSNRTLIVYIDAFDVIFQENVADFFASTISSEMLVYGSELNCHPYRSALGDKCEVMVGTDYLASRTRWKHFDDWEFKPGDVRPLGCVLQDQLVPSAYNSSHFRYTNAGMSFGYAGLYERLCNECAKLMVELPAGCHDDQGFVSWLMGKRRVPITLDYARRYFGNKYMTNYEFDESTCAWKPEGGNGGHRSPSFLHHNGYKHQFLYYRDKIARCLFKNEVSKYYEAVSNFTFYVNGEVKRFTETCHTRGPADVFESDILLKAHRGASVYLYRNNILREFYSADVFIAHGFDFGDVYAIGSDQIKALPRGPPIVSKPPDPL